MAGLLLDRIINDTIHKTLGGSDSYEERILKDLQSSSDQFNRSAGDPTSSSSDQFDNLTQLMQSVEMGHFERIVWILFFFVMVLIASGGNVVVIYIVSTNKEMKSVTNYFLVNLSLADTMVSTLNVIFNFISMLNSHWPFGKLYCKISNFIAILSISASVFTLTAISCDRYNAIIHPLRPRMSHRSALGWILLIWTLSSALALPNAIYSTLVEDRLMSDSFATTCTMIWPDGRYPLSSYDHIYNIIVLVTTYLVPILTMAILYYKVGNELWGYEAIGENVEKQRRAIMAKKKIVKMMIVVVIIFALCWLPYHAFFVVNYYLPTIFQDAPLYYQRCYLLMYWLAMSNSMYNPIIIYFMNSKFRLEFKKVLYFIVCCRVHTQPPRAVNANLTSGALDRSNTIGAPGKRQTSILDRATREGNKFSLDRQASGRPQPSRHIGINGRQLTAGSEPKSSARQLLDVEAIDEVEENEVAPFISTTITIEAHSGSAKSNGVQMDLNGRRGEKLIDFGRKTTTNSNQNCDNGNKSAPAAMDKVWI